MKAGIITVIVITLLGVGGFVLMNRNDDTPSTPTSTSDTTTTTTPAETNTEPEKESAAELTYTNDGFTPATLTLKAGTKVKITNESASTLQFYSDPHPTHSEPSDLNLGTINRGESKTFTVTRTGTHGYHNHLNPGDTGTIIVQ